MSDPHSAELARNFSFFEGLLPELLAAHRGEYALLRSCQIVDFFSKPIDAAAAGNARFADGLFSVQRVWDRPLDLGFLSYGPSDGTAN